MRVVRNPLGAEPMTWRWGHGRAAMTGLLLATCLACSSADPIPSGNVNVFVKASTAPAYAGEYQWARLQLDQITLRPLDEQENSYLEIPLGLVRSFGQIDARSPQVLTLATTPLRAGTYRLETLRVSQLSLNLFNAAPQLASSCCVQNDPPQAGDCDPAVTLLKTARVGPPIILEFADGPLLQVPQGGSAQVNVVVDGPALVQMLLDQPWTCGSGSFPTPTAAQVAQVITLN